MPRIHFLTYAHTANPLGAPAQWPAMMRHDEGEPVAPWQSLPLEQYESYLAKYRPAFEAWAKSQVEKQIALATAAEEGQKQFLLTVKQTTDPATFNKLPTATKFEVLRDVLNKTAAQQLNQ